jgi:hypothetical protein
MDETHDNMQGKDNGRAGGKNFAIGNSLIPRDVVGTNNSHFTVVPILDMN